MRVARLVLADDEVDVKSGTVVFATIVNSVLVVQVVLLRTEVVSMLGT